MMDHHGGRTRWPLVLAGVSLAVAIAAFNGLYEHWSGVMSRTARGHGSRAPAPARASASASDIGAVSKVVWRFEPSNETVLAWARSAHSRRKVVDQVCLVPDVGSFFEAIALWDDRHYFPVLIDDPAWTLPFLRAFRPARVVRLVSRRKGWASKGNAADRLALWQSALRAVASSWRGADARADRRPLPPAGGPPRGIEDAPPGLVLSAPDSPMLAGAVALAAGRFQPLVRLEPGAWPLDGPDGTLRAYHWNDVLSLPQAWRFAERVEGLVASLVPHYRRLGDDCDFLTIAGDWPYRYEVLEGRGPERGIRALDDLIGREPRGGPDAEGLNASRRRWAYAGRLIGGPAESVAHAMAALFLQPGPSLLWNTYGTNLPWSFYTLAPLAEWLDRYSDRPDVAVVHRFGASANLREWHRTLGAQNRHGFLWLNSSGGPRDFSIGGGPGRPADLPRGAPAAVVMVHSFSAANPADRDTIAGRWLARGAFVYYGSVNEPYVNAFRPPVLTARLIAARVPFVAALRQGETEAFGRPWRLIYLGDPLFRLDPDNGTPPSRLGPGDWELNEREQAAERTFSIIASAETGPCAWIGSPPNGPARALFDWCRDAAAALAVGADDPTEQEAADRERSRSDGHDHGYRSALARIDRGQLNRTDRAALDDLWIDALGQCGDLAALQAKLATVPPNERGPRVWQELEFLTTNRIARLDWERGPQRAFAEALEIWGQAIRLGWPAASEFPAQITERISALARADAPNRLALWRDRLRRAAIDLARMPGQARHLEAVMAADVALSSHAPAGAN